MSRRPRPISDRLRQAIEASTMSRYAISKATGIPQSSLSRFVDGTAGLTLDNADAVAELLGVELRSHGRRRASRK